MSDQPRIPRVVAHDQFAGALDEFLRHLGFDLTSNDVCMPLKIEEVNGELSVTFTTIVPILTMP